MRSISDACSADLPRGWLAVRPARSSAEIARRVKVLKRHSRLAVTLAPKAMPRSMVADDIVGMTVAGLAMSAALVTIWLAQRNTPYGVLYLAIYVAGYILKVLLAWFALLTNPALRPKLISHRAHSVKVAATCHRCAA